MRIIAVIFVSLVLSRSARAVTINLSFDSSVSNSASFPQIKQALEVVTNTYHLLFTNASTVNLTCYWGAVGPFSGGVNLGENVHWELGPFAYADITNALHNARSSANDSNSVASLPAGDPIATNKWWVPRAQVKALPYLAAKGSLVSTDSLNDGSITFDSTVTFAFSPTNRVVPGEYDFIGVAEHEISEVMGRIYGLNAYSDGVYIPYDLFRFTNSGARNFNIDATNVYFSVNNGTNKLKMFCENYATTGDDPQDWQPGPVPDGYDATTSPGVILRLTPVDLTAMDILGYNLPVFSPSHLKGSGTNGAFVLSFTNVASAPFSVFASASLAPNPTNWTYLGAPVENPPGQYQFRDVSVATSRFKFYRVSLP